MCVRLDCDWLCVVVWFGCFCVLSFVCVCVCAFLRVRFVCDVLCCFNVVVFGKLSVLFCFVCDFAFGIFVV